MALIVRRLEAANNETATPTSTPTAKNNGSPSLIGRSSAKTKQNSVTHIGQAGSSSKSGDELSTPKGAKVPWKKVVQLLFLFHCYILADKKGDNRSAECKYKTSEH